MIAIDSTYVKLSNNGFVATIAGNGGENELVFIGSAGQDMKLRIIAVAAGVDGGLDLGSQKSLALDRVRAYLTDTITMWVQNGIKPSLLDMKAENVKIKKVVEAIAEHFVGETDSSTADAVLVKKRR